MVSPCFPIFLGQQGKMLRPDIPQWGSLAFFGMMVFKTAFIHDPAGLNIPLITTAPHSFHTEFIEAAHQQTVHGFRYKPLPPIRNANPISDFCITGLHFRTVNTLSNDNANTANRLIGFLQHHGVCFRSRKDIPYHFPAVLDRRVWRPTRNRANCPVLRIFVKRLRIIFRPRTEYKSFGIHKSFILLGHSSSGRLPISHCTG